MYIHSTIVLLFIQYHINVLTLKSFTLLDRNHCVKSVQIRITFWSVFSLIRTEYREILRISPYSVRMRENTDQKILRIWTLFTEWICYICSTQILYIYTIYLIVHCLSLMIEICKLQHFVSEKVANEWKCASASHCQFYFLFQKRHSLWLYPIYLSSVLALC